MTEEHRIEIQTDAKESNEKTADASDTATMGEADHASEDEIEEQPAETPRAEAKTDAPEDDLQIQLEKAQAEAQTHYESFLRAAAELDNFRKRKEREVSDLRKYANQNLLRELLNVVDNLERAIGAPRESEGTDGLLEGVDMTLKELLKIFDKFGVTPIEAVNQPFDPSLHEAVMQEENADVAENTVIRELQRGYQIHDRLLRPAMVVVSR